MDGFLMARTLLGDTREQALAGWDGKVGESPGGVRAEYARAKPGFREETAYTEEFLRSVPELESFRTGLAFVLLTDDAYNRRLEELEGTELGRIGVPFQGIFKRFMRAGLLARGRPPRPEDRDLLPVFRHPMETFEAEMRGYGLRRRLHYLGKILGLLEGVARGPVPAEARES